MMVLGDKSKQLEKAIQLVQSVLLTYKPTGKDRLVYHRLQRAQEKIEQALSDIWSEEFEQQEGER